MAHLFINGAYVWIGTSKKMKQIWKSCKTCLSQCFMNRCDFMKNSCQSCHCVWRYKLIFDDDYHNAATRRTFGFNLLLHQCGGS